MDKNYEPDLKQWVDEKLATLALGEGMAAPIIEATGG